MSLSDPAHGTLLVPEYDSEEEDDDHDNDDSRGSHGLARDEEMQTRHKRSQSSRRNTLKRDDNDGDEVRLPDR